MIKVEQAIIVEGKYDKIKLESFIDAIIIETDGFAVFKNKEKQSLIRRLAEKRGIVILTDSDSAGFIIRNFLGGCLPKDKVFHVYIPDIFGKEKRKDSPSKEGKLGVEGIEKEIIINAFKKAGILCSEKKSEAQKITNYHLYEDGFTGGKNSKSRRAQLLKKLDFPERISTSALLQLMNAFMTFEEYKSVVNIIDENNDGGAA